MEENSSGIEELHEPNRAGQDTVTEEYEARMLEAFVGKPDTPEKGLWYANSFSKYDMNGVDVMKWNWSWWAFFGGIWFLLYRKAYAAAGGLLLISILASFIPFSGIIISILAGGFSTYAIYKVYKTKKHEIEASTMDEEQRIEMMRVVGGYNAWVAWVFPIIVLLGILAALVLPKLEDTQMNQQQMQEFQMQYQQNVQ